jgi:alkylated DNA repair protein alkB family protein 8
VIDAPQQEFENVLRTPLIEASNVHKVYDTVASSWHGTRYKAWPKVDEFLRSLPFGSMVADLGCGNGKNVPAIKDNRCFAVPCDISAPLVRIAAEEHGVSGFVCDGLNTPLRAGVFDAAISIAVLHHLSTEVRRVQALREAARLLRPGGRFLVYCWSFEQDGDVSRSRHRFGGQDVLVPFHYKATSSEGGSLEQAVMDRYCHVYRQGELEQLLAQVPELDVEEIYFDTGNWCAISRRNSF